MFAGLGSGERATVALAESPEPEAWSLKVRGDLLQLGKLGAQKVPFGEFLRTRLEACGDVLTIDEVSSWVNEEPGKPGASVVVMPTAAPHAARA